MVIAVLGQDAVGLQTVGVDDRAFLGGGLGEREQRGSGRVRQHLKAQPTRAASPDLDRHGAQRLLPALTATFEAFLVPAEEELVDLDLELLTLRSDHCARSLCSIASPVRSHDSQSPTWPRSQDETSRPSWQ